MSIQSIVKKLAHSTNRIYKKSPYELKSELQRYLLKYDINYDSDLINFNFFDADQNCDSFVSYYLEFFTDETLIEIMEELCNREESLMEEIKKIKLERDSTNVVLSVAEQIDSLELQSGKFEFIIDDLDAIKEKIKNNKLSLDRNISDDFRLIIEKTMRVILNNEKTFENNINSICERLNVIDPSTVGMVKVLLNTYKQNTNDTVKHHDKVSRVEMYFISDLSISILRLLTTIFQD